jgi:hypothetical protein
MADDAAAPGGLRRIPRADVDPATGTYTGPDGRQWYHPDTAKEVDAIRTQSVQIATEGTIDLLSYTPDNVEAKLNSAGDRLTRSFKDSYLALVRNTVLPGAKQKGISANATVPAGLRCRRCKTRRRSCSS